MVGLRYIVLSLLFIVLFFSSVSFALSSSYLAAEVDETFASESIGINKRILPLDLLLDKQLRDDSEEWLSAAKSKDIEKIEKLSEAVRAGIDRVGTKNFRFLAEVALLFAKQAYKQDHYDLAILFAKNVSLFAPDYPDGWLLQGYSFLMQDPFNFRSYVLAFYKAVKATLYSKLNLINLAYDLATFFYFLIGFTFLTVFILSIGFYFKLFVLNISSLLPGYRESFFKYCSAALIFLLILVYGGIFFFFISLAIATFAFYRKDGRVLIGLFLSFLLTIPYAIDFFSNRIASDSEKVYEVISDLAEESWERSYTPILYSYYQSDDKALKYTSAYLIGLINIFNRNYAQAAVWFKESSKSDDPDMRSRSKINLGVSIFRSGKFGESIQYFESALKDSPDNVIGLFNLSNAYLETVVNGSKARAAFDKAISIDGALVKKLLIGIKDDYFSKVANIGVSNKDIWTIMDRSRKETEIIRSMIWEKFFYPVDKDRYYYFVLSLFVILIVILLMDQRRTVYRSCRSCGISFEINSEVVKQDLSCDQCDLVIGSGGPSWVASNERDIKREQIRKYTKRINFGSNLLDKIYPGVGQLYYGYTLRSFFILGMSNMFMLYFIFKIGKYISDLFITPTFIIGDIVFLLSGFIYWIVVTRLLKVGD